MFHVLRLSEPVLWTCELKCVRFLQLYSVLWALLLAYLHHLNTLVGLNVDFMAPSIWLFLSMDQVTQVTCIPLHGALWAASPYAPPLLPPSPQCRYLPRISTDKIMFLIICVINSEMMACLFSSCRDPASRHQQKRWTKGFVMQNSHISMVRHSEMWQLKQQRVIKTQR